MPAYEAPELTLTLNYVHDLVVSTRNSDHDDPTYELSACLSGGAC
jgi:hypothetical protein